MQRFCFLALSIDEHFIQMYQTMNTFTKTTLLLGLLCCFMACDRDSTFEEEEIGRNPLESTIFIEGTLTGLVVDENQQPIAQATIEIVGNSATTDEFGFFRIPEAAMSEYGSLIKVSKEGFIDGYKFGFMEADQTAIIKIQLVQNQVVGEVASDTGGLIDISGGATLMLPADAVALESGGAYAGPVRVRAHYYNPQGGEHLAETMPGDLRGIDAEGTAVQLLTYGMVSVDLIGANGQELQLREGSAATLSFPIASSAAPDEIPMWFLDEDSGMWREEGLATRIGDFYVSQVSHFSFWNCDFPGRLVRLSGRLVSIDGFPISGQLVSLTNEDLNMAGTGYTNENGLFTGLVPAGIPLLLSTLDCIDDHFELGILSADTFLDDFSLSDENALRITGLLLDCNSNPNPNAYLMLRSSSRSIIYPPRATGIINDAFYSCDEEEITVIAFDPKTLSISNEISHQITESEFDFGNLDVCEDDPFISFSFNQFSFLLTCLLYTSDAADEA